MKKLKNVITGILMTIFSFTSYAQSPSDIEGEYIVGKQNTVVKIERQEGVYTGKIISSDNPNVKIGKLMVKDLKGKKGKWKGKIYAPKRNEWYDAEFKNKRNKLYVEVSVGFFSKTVEWIRK